MEPLPTSRAPQHDRSIAVLEEKETLDQADIEAILCPPAKDPKPRLVTETA